MNVPCDRSPRHSLHQDVTKAGPEEQMIKEKRPEGCFDIGRFRLLNNLREQYGALVISCYSATSRHKNCVLGWKVCTGRDDSRSTVIRHTRELENNMSLLICFRFFSWVLISWI